MTDAPQAHSHAVLASVGDIELADVYWYRWAPCVAHNPAYEERVQRLLARGLDGWALRESARHPMLARRSRAWIVLEAGDGAAAVFANGIFLLARGLEEQQLAALLRQAGLLGEDAEDGAEEPRAEGRLRGPHHGGRATLLPLYRAVPDLDRSVAYLSIWTTAALALDGLAHFHGASPRVTGRRIVEERLAHSRMLNLLKRLGTGELVADALGAPAAVHAGLADAAERRRERLEIEAFVAGPVSEAIEDADRRDARPGGHPLLALLRPLAAFTVSRDEREIRIEAEERAAHTTAQAASALLLLLVAIQLARLSTTVALVLAGGLAAVVAASRALLLAVGGGLRDAAHRKVLAANRDGSSCADGSLAESVASVNRAGTTVIVGEGVGAVDFACAFSIWWELLVKHGAAQLAPRRERGVVERTIVVGGPLVTPRDHLPLPVCELRPRPRVAEGWAYSAAARPLVRDRDDEAVGCMSGAYADATVLYVNGFRSTRLATELLLCFVHGAAQPDNCAWRLLDEHAGA